MACGYAANNKNNQVQFPICMRPFNFFGIVVNIRRKIPMEVIAAKRSKKDKKKDVIVQR